MELNGVQEVAGSNPVAPTIADKGLRESELESSVNCELTGTYKK